jgi:hypothetical protein
VREAGFVPHHHAYLVHGPRVLTTAGVRIMRKLRRTRSDRAIDRLLRRLDTAGRRAPIRMGAFEAVVARPADGAQSRA